MFTLRKSLLSIMKNPQALKFIVEWWSCDEKLFISRCKFVSGSQGLVMSTEYNSQERGDFEIRLK